MASSDLSIEYTHNGIVISAMRGGYRVKKTYQGYTLKEAKADFNSVHGDE